MRAVSGSVCACSSRWIASSSSSSSRRARWVSGPTPPAGWRSRTGGPPLRVEGDALVLGRQEPAGPVERPRRRRWGCRGRRAGRRRRGGPRSRCPARTTARRPSPGSPSGGSRCSPGTMPGMWFAVSATIELITVSSSATSAISGRGRRPRGRSARAGGTGSATCGAGPPCRRRRRPCRSSAGMSLPWYFSSSGL